jgi:hypothetical protein
VFRSRPLWDAASSRVKNRRVLARIVLSAAIAVLAAIVALVAGGWFNTPHSHRAGISATQLRLVQPFDLSGKLLAPYTPAVTLPGGSCVNSSESSDPGALHCFSGSRSADPCWQSGTESGGVDVACLSSPWDFHVLLFINPVITAMPGASIGPPAWAMEIVQPGHARHDLQCALVAGSPRVIAGMPARWACYQPGLLDPSGLAGYALGTPHVATGRPWTVWYVPAKGTHPVETPVTSVWR